MSPHWRVPYVWALFMAGPLAWSVVFAILQFLTHPVCESGNRGPMSLAGVVAAGIVILAGILALRALRDFGVSVEPSLRFVAAMAIWGNALFLLVIALTMYPVSLLSPCGV